MKIYHYICLAPILLGLVLSFPSCNNQSETRLKVAATSVPHADILQQVKPILRNDGIELDIIVIDDYQIPNRALADKEVDANFFQHLPFLELQNRELGYDLISFAKIHLEPMGLYSKKLKKISDLPANGVAVVPNDPTNQARALLLLEKAGLITLKKWDITITKLDIIGNPKNLKIVEVDASILPRTIEDSHLAAIPANFALQADLSPVEDALVIEDKHSLFVNILVIRSEDRDRKDLNLLKKALSTDSIKEYIDRTYRGAIITAFETLENVEEAK